MGAVTKAASYTSDVSALLRARNTLLWIVSREEARVERALVEACSTASYAPIFWDCANGLTRFDGAAVDSGVTDPGTALLRVRDSRQREVYVLRDIHKWLADPTVLRAMRSLARSLSQSPRNESRSIIVLSPSSEVPPELAGHAIVLDWPLPDRDEVAEILDGVLAALPDDIRTNAAPNGTREAAIDAAIGLSAEEIQSCYAKSLVSLKRIDPKVVSSEKRRVVAKSGKLEWYEPIPGGLDAVGGLDVLKAWLGTRKAAFTSKAREYGLPAPKGALLVGVPGCGKSLTAKAIATAWGMPLLRLDLGALKSKWVGDSEANVRSALKLAETVSPCVVWLDEIEKALGGATQGAADGGVSSDALGSILSWMQDREGRVFVVATANDVSALPPELLRKGRFDELFFVDLPTYKERVAIIQAALKAHGRRESVNPDAIAQCTVDFTGAEIAALVPEALYVAFADEARGLTTDDLMNAASHTVPLARTSAERITKLREWAKSRARNASMPEVVNINKRQLDL